jgi:HEAT repeats
MRDAIQRTLALVALVFALVLHAAPAAADDVDDLAKTMSSSSEKARISAAASLARLEDKRALKPLVAALRDPSPKVRAIAAVGLGRLKHKAAFAALKNTASDDTDDMVRDKARDAMIAVAKANDMMDSLPPDAQPAPVASGKPAKHAKGFGHSPHAVEARPDLYVLVKSSSDDSPGKADKFTRKANGDIVKQALLDSFKTAPQVTLAAADAQRWGLDPRAIDLSVTHLDVNDENGMVEIDAELRLAISDENGKMLSFVSGGAKVQVPSGKFNTRYLPQFRKQALEGAMQGLFDKLLDHLRQTTQS